VVPHLDELVANLATVAALVKLSREEEGTDEERRAGFVERLRLELRRTMPEAQSLTYEAATPLDLMWLGLARFWRKRG
jgi:hypothetical protein